MPGNQDLVSLILSSGLAVQGRTDFSYTYAGSTTGSWSTTNPPTGFEAAIVYWISYDDMPAGVFQKEISHPSFPSQTIILDHDEIHHGISMWLYITTVNPLSQRITNLDSLAQRISGTRWTLNIRKLRQMDMIKLFVWEYAAPGTMKVALEEGMLQELPNLPEDAIGRVLKYRMNK